MSAEVIAVNGGKWGDEGKGKIVDYFAQSADVVIRAQGGDNAGHTIKNGNGKFVLHQVPSGIFNPDCLNIIGTGTVFNPVSFINEIANLQEKGIDASNIRISSRAALVLPVHIIEDKLREKQRGNGGIGTTNRGIGPSYTDRTSRDGLSVADINDLDTFMGKLKPLLKRKRDSYPDAENQELHTDYYEDLRGQWFLELEEYITDSQALIIKYLRHDSKIVIEGAQGTLLDKDYGTLPYVTSSSTTIGGLLQGAGIPPSALTQAIGVFKAYDSRVGNGGFPTELKGEEGDRLRELGQEYGATTNRPRRVGWFDGVAALYSSQLNGYTDIALTRLDTLSEFGEAQINYSYFLNGEPTGIFPANNNYTLERCIPCNISKFEMKDISWVRKFKDLPSEAQFYCNRISQITGTRLSLIGVGEGREDLIII